MIANPWEWTEKDLLRLIDDEVQESINLDYKRSAALAKSSKEKDDIGKDVSAFANSAGGTLVYGVMENNKFPPIPTGLDEGCDPNVITREWLDQIISAVQPHIEGVRIKQIPLSDTRMGKVAYVVYVPQSARSPHQAPDYRYYKRYEYRSVPMEDYEVRDVGRRFETPDLWIGFDLLKQIPPEVALDPDDTSGIEAHIMPFVGNNSDTPAECFISDFFLDPNISIVGSPGLSFSESTSPPIFGEPRAVYQFVHNWAPPIYGMPAFKDAHLSLFQWPLKIAVTKQGRYFVGWKIVGPRMKPKHGAFVLSRNKNKIELQETSLSGLT